MIAHLRSQRYETYVSKYQQQFSAVPELWRGIRCLLSSRIHSRQACGIVLLLAGRYAGLLTGGNRG